MVDRLLLHLNEKFNFLLLFFCKRKYQYNDSIRTIFGLDVFADMVACYNNAYLMAENTKLETHAKEFRMIFALILLAILSLFSVIYAIVRRRTIRRLRVEQDAAEEARKKAEQADRLKSAFLQNMSHEIRTPLNAIVRFTDIFSSDSVNMFSKVERSNFQRITRENASYLLALINDVLDLAKLESGNYTLKNEYVEINGLCHTVVSSVQSCVAFGVSLIFEPSPVYGQLVIRTDE